MKWLHSCWQEPLECPPRVMHASCSCATVELAAWRGRCDFGSNQWDMNKKARLSRLVHHAIDKVSDLI